MAWNHYYGPSTGIGIPTRDLIMVIQVTVRFLPLLAQTAERIAKAQAARGAEWGTGQGNLIQRARAVIPLLVPLFVTSLHKAENMALAMDAACLWKQSPVYQHGGTGFQAERWPCHRGQRINCLAILSLPSERRQIRKSLLYIQKPQVFEYTK